MEDNTRLKPFSAAVIMSRAVLCGLFIWSFFAQYMALMIISLFFMLALVFGVISPDSKKYKPTYADILLKMCCDKLCQIVAAGCIVSRLPVLLPVFLAVVLREAFLLIGNITIAKMMKKIPRGKLNDNILMYMFFFCAALIIASNSFFPSSDLMNVVSWLIISGTVVFAVVSFILLYRAFQNEIAENRCL